MPDSASKPSPSELTLGWQIQGDGTPTYRVPKDVPNDPPLQNLVTVAGKDMGRHTVIVAQSGSGKSFFLGRLIEELVLKTLARVVVLDPNGDFRGIRAVVAAKKWTDAGYDPPNEKFDLPTEAKREQFAPTWESFDTAVRFGPQAKAKGIDRLRVPWSTIPMAFLGEDLDPIARGQVYHCHQFVRAIAALEAEREGSKPAIKNWLKTTQDLLSRARASGAKVTIEQAFPLMGTTKAGAKPSLVERVAKTSDDKAAAALDILSTLVDFWRKSQTPLTSRRARDSAISAVEFISPEIERYYFGLAQEYVAADVISSELTRTTALAARKCTVIDLPSFRDVRTQHLVLSSVVTSVWDRAKDEWASAFELPADADVRVPVFLVIEEAHNIIPTGELSPSAEALRAQIRTIAAEGRKYGVFLVIVTQRPDKLDPLVVSECENRAIMRLASDAVLDKTKSLLGLDEIAELNQCLSFQTGRFLLAGHWAKNATRTGYCAMRRTVEGGRSLRDKHWAQAEPTVPPAGSKPR